MTSGCTAKFGRPVSGVVNVSTKSGSNDLHGDLYDQISHPKLGVSDPFGGKVLEKLQQFGGSAGGPLRRDKALWFAAIQRQASFLPSLCGVSVVAHRQPQTRPGGLRLLPELGGALQGDQRRMGDDVLFALPVRRRQPFDGSIQLQQRGGAEFGQLGGPEAGAHSQRG